MKKSNFIISYSSLKLFMDSPKAFYNKYIGKIKYSHEQTDEMVCGKVVHDVLSYCENYAKKYKINKLDKERIDYFLNEFNERLKKYPKISYKIKRRYKDCLREYLVKRAGREKVLETEKRFTITTTNGVPITGVIDKIVEPKPGYIEIVDYKTSENMLTKEEIKNDLQLSFYDIAAKKLFRNKKVYISIHYLAHDKKVVARRYRKDRIEFNKFLKRMNTRISKMFNKSGDI